MSTTLQWFKSTYSSSEGGQCLEVATSTHAIHIRDSKNPAATGPTLQLTPAAWAAFTADCAAR
ncbi:DUF397 domain-containing protein [Streptomyces pseudovenezuelae]|uniref:DUF397 domain-containing protein n=1 Tax=Streptomyces pseudovenezuelae TaxID=67350 RepID=A0ABT6M251_9ACTN|nr:DUF397 domain-containing protein [Streptomyces pseudovenezuelae]MDH6222624.1 hypothetical protein [Streptomyces pseudovenezuelae]